MDYAKLRGRIKEKYGTETNFASEIGKTKAWLSAILNNKISLKKSTMELFIEYLDIDSSEINVYFFN